MKSYKDMKEAAFQLEAIVQSSRDAIISKALDGKIISWNKGAEQMYGYTPEETAGKNISILFPAEKKHEMNELLSDISKGRVIENFETQRVKKSGENINVLLTISPIRNDKNEIIAASSIAHDITDKKRKEESLRQLEHNYNEVFEFSPIGVFKSDFEGNILTSNSALANLLGYFSKDEFMNLNLRKDVFFDPEDSNKIFSKYKPATEAIDLELKWKRRNGSPIWIELNAHKVKDQAGKILYYQGFVRDISISKIQKEQLIQAKEEAEKSDRLKTEFLTQISHEIRTPLNNIISYTSILKEEFEAKLPLGFENAFKVIDVSSDRLIRTIDLIINLSKIQTGNFETNFSKFDIEKDLLDELTMEYYSRAKMKNLALKYNNAANRTRVYADQYSLEQIFINLIDNAIKYTSKGEIDITLKNENDKVCITVCDSGIGISKDYLPKLFSPFSQEEAGINRRFDGTGLGLALVKKYAEINNAEINVKSAKGKGTQFTIALPISD